MCVISDGMEWVTAEGTRRRMGYFSWGFFFLCSVIQHLFKTEVQFGNEQVTAMQLYGKTWAAQCSVLSWGLKTLHVLQKQTLSAFLRAYKYWLSSGSSWSRVCIQKAVSFGLRIEAKELALWICPDWMETMSKAYQLVRKQKCIQPLQIKLCQWEEDRLWFPRF